MGRSTLHYKTRVDNHVTLSYFHTLWPQFEEIYNKIHSKLGPCAPKHALGGLHAQEAPNKNIVTSLESLYWRDDLCVESLQLFSNYVEVNNTLSCCLLDLLHMLFQDLYVWGASLHQCVHPVCLRAFRIYLLWWWKPRRFKAGCMLLGLPPYVMPHPPTSSLL